MATAPAHTGLTGSGEQLGSPKARSVSQACPRADILITRVQWMESLSRKQL